MNIQWFDSRESILPVLQRLAPQRRVLEPWLDGKPEVEGYCAGCDRIESFKNPELPADEWRDLRESFVCGCGLSGRGRMARGAILQEVDRLGATQPGAENVLLFERVTPFFERIQKDLPQAGGCEWLGEDAAPGEIRKHGGIKVRHEDMMQLSFGDRALDLIFHGDVLEHVPDFRRGLAECHRVLRPGGALLFTVPMFDLAEHLVRAEIVGGRLVHHLEPAFHGNPVSDEGSLVFTHHGWPLLQDMRDAGFAVAQIGLLYDPSQGIVSNNNPYPEGHMWPVMFRGERRLS